MWDYRVMRQHGKIGDIGWVSYGIHEVYGYRKDGRAGAHTRGGVGPSGETFEELKSNYELMSEAFNKPVLDFETGKEIE